MGEMNQPVTKIYCDDRGRDDSLGMAAMMGNQWMNNPFAYMMMVAMMRMWNNNGFEGGNTQLASIQDQLQDNHNNDLVMQAVGGNMAAVRELSANLNCGLGTVNSAICAVREAVASVAGQVGFSAERVINAVNMGDCSVIQAVKDCCCATQRQIADFRGDIALQMCQQTNTLERGLDFVNRSVERGFAAASYETQRQTCDIINAGNANTQRIIDTLNGHWSAEDKLKIQDLKFENSQLKQNQLILNAIRGNCGCGDSCGCGCGNGRY